jgi:uncharacterized integral membrane protein
MRQFRQECGKLIALERTPIFYMWIHRYRKVFACVGNAAYEKTFKELVVLFLILGVFLLLGGLVTLIAAQNLTLLVHLNLFLWHTPDLPIGVWFAGAFVFGAIVLYFTSVVSAVGDRREIKALRQEVRTLKEKNVPVSAPSTEQAVVERLSSAGTGPLLPMSGAMKAPLPMPSSRIPTSPLPPQQDFPQ